MWLVSWHVDRNLTTVNVIIREKNMGAFHSTKNSENLGTGANVTEISREKFPEYQKCDELKFRIAFHSTKHSGKPGWRPNGKGNYPEFQFWVYLARLSSNSGKYWKILFYSSRGIPEISNQSFWPDGKRPLTLDNCAEKKDIFGGLCFFKLTLVKSFIWTSKSFKFWNKKWDF